MANSVKEEVANILQVIARHINCLGEENRNTRKRAIEGIRKEVLGHKPTLENDVLQGVFDDLVKPVAKLLSDPVEKCRELAILFITDVIKNVENIQNYLPYLMPMLVQRLGQPEIIEPSEELRLELVQLLSVIIEKSQRSIAPYLDDLINILQRTIPDQYSEVKKGSCKCASQTAKAIPDYFHQQSESLIKPLTESISHQHSRVRVEVILAIGDVIQYGNNKSVDDVVSHFAQRLFDQAPTVRASITQVVGNWLLDLLDRYSFFHKLIPLLLTSVQDEMPDIRSQAETLWNDVGLKYESENEDDLKDKQDFVKAAPEHYPPGLERPNLGCRTLVYRNFSKILSGLYNDIVDWVSGTRIKSAQLLYTLIINEEDNVTQHLEKVLSCLQRAAGDDEQEVIEYINKSAELIGYFVPPEIWVEFVLKHVKLAQSPGSLMLLASVLRGSEGSTLQPHLSTIIEAIHSSDIYQIAESRLQQELLKCIEALLAVCGENCSQVALEMFIILITVLSQARKEDLSQKAHHLLDILAMCLGIPNRQQLFNQYTKPAILSIKSGYAHWTQHSIERHFFDTLLMESGPVVGELLEEVIPILVTNLHPDKNAEVRLTFFNLLSKLLLNAPKTLNSENRFGEFSVVVIRDMILPNCVWVAGRAAAALRTTAVSCLWALLQSHVLSADKLLEVSGPLFTQMRSTMEDDNKSTRLVTCRVLGHVFRLLGRRLDQDTLHNMAPDLLKRLDDSDDDIRVAMCTTFTAYFDCFMENYNVQLYQAHLEALYKGLLIHLDDPETRIREAVLEVLKKASELSPGMCIREVEAVKHKHRTTKYCDILLQHAQALPSKS